MLVLFVVILAPTAFVPAARITAVNAKFAEMQKTAPKEKEAAAQNAAGEVF
jgi:hypothetical protein